MTITKALKIVESASQVSQNKGSSLRLREKKCRGTDSERGDGAIPFSSVAAASATGRKGLINTQRNVWAALQNSPLRLIEEEGGTELHEICSQKLEFTK